MAPTLQLSGFGNLAPLFLTHALDCMGPTSGLNPGVESRLPLTYERRTPGHQSIKLIRVDGGKFTVGDNRLHVVAQAEKPASVNTFYIADSALKVSHFDEYFEQVQKGFGRYGLIGRHHPTNHEFVIIRDDDPHALSEWAATRTNQKIFGVFEGMGFDEGSRDFSFDAKAVSLAPDPETWRKKLKNDSRSADWELGAEYASFLSYYHVLGFIDWLNQSVGFDGLSGFYPPTANQFERMMRGVNDDPNVYWSGFLVEDSFGFKGHRGVTWNGQEIHRSNLWEWCRDWVDESQPNNKVLKGGSLLFAPLSSGLVMGENPGAVSIVTGARLAASPLSDGLLNP